MSTVPDARIVALTQQLLEAQTIGEIFALPFPATVAYLENPAHFASFYRPSGENHLLAEIVDNGQQIAPVNSLPQEQLDTIREPLKIAGAFGHAVLEAVRPRSLPNPNHVINAWHGSLKEYMSGRYSHGNMIHFDHPEARPNDLIGLTVSSNHSLSVPHNDALTILGKSKFAHIFDVRLTDPNLDGKLTELYNFITSHPIADELEEAMVKSPINAFNINAGITIHEQPAYISKKRVCSKIVMNFVNE